MNNICICPYNFFSALSLTFFLTLSKVIDACMRLHNFIVDFREEANGEADNSLFDEDCRKFLAVHPDVEANGVFGGEDEEKRDAQGNKLVGGRPRKNELMSRKHGITQRDMLRDDIRQRQLVQPATNWYKNNNRLLEDYGV